MIVGTVEQLVRGYIEQIAASVQQSISKVLGQRWKKDVIVRGDDVVKE